MFINAMHPLSFLMMQSQLQSQSLLLLLLLSLVTLFCIQPQLHLFLINTRKKADTWVTQAISINEFIT